MCKVDAICEPNPSLGRIVITEDWIGDVNTARHLLLAVMRKWPPRTHLQALVTCGAFLWFDWPSALHDVGDNKNPEPWILKTLIAEAEEQCRRLLDTETRTALAEKTDFLTIGIDSAKERDSLGNVRESKPHAELVALVDLHRDAYRWTGKSFPTPRQERGLVRFSDIRSHFVKLPFGRAMILGCHDLSVFNLRGAATATQEWRKRTRKAFYDAVKVESPEVVLHHPHITDSSKTWRADWNELVRAAPSLKEYVGAGRWYRSPRTPLPEVLAATKRGASLDFVARDSSVPPGD